MLPYGGLVSGKGAKYKPMKNKFISENFACRLFCSFSSNFVMVYFEMSVLVTYRKKIIEIVYFGSSRSFQVISVDTPEKPIKSCCYGKWQVYVYLQSFYARWANSGKITTFSEYSCLMPSCTVEVGCSPDNKSDSIPKNSDSIQFTSSRVVAKGQMGRCPPYIFSCRKIIKISFCRKMFV